MIVLQCNPVCLALASGSGINFPRIPDTIISSKPFLAIVSFPAWWPFAFHNPISYPAVHRRPEKASVHKKHQEPSKHQLEFSSAREILEHTHTSWMQNESCIRSCFISICVVWVKTCQKYARQSTSIDPQTDTKWYQYGSYVITYLRCTFKTVLGLKKTSGLQKNEIIVI